MKKILPPPIFFILSLAGVLIFGCLQILKVIIYPYNLIGILFIILGIIFSGSAGKLFLRHKTTIDPNKTSKKLVITGPYKVTRNPMYLGAFFVLLGGSIIFGSLISILFSFLFPLLIHLIIIPYEEKILTQTFGKEYLSYKKRVRRWI